MLEPPPGWEVKKAKTFQGGTNFDIFYHREHIAIAFSRETAIMICNALELLYSHQVFSDEANRAAHVAHEHLSVHCNKPDLVDIIRRIDVEK